MRATKHNSSKSLYFLDLKDVYLKHQNFVSFSCSWWVEISYNNFKMSTTCIRNLFCGVKVHVVHVHTRLVKYAFTEKLKPIFSLLDGIRNKLSFRKETVSVKKDMFVMCHLYKQHLEINIVSLFICCIIFLSCIEFISLDHKEFLWKFIIFVWYKYCALF